METKRGCVHLYFGDGKGKTTAAMGLSLRAAGSGKKVLLCQFLKGNHSSERNALQQIENITCLKGSEQTKFTYQMTEEEKEENKRQQLKMLTEMIDQAGNYDMLVFDEVLYAIDLGQIPEEVLLTFLKNRPDQVEVVLTGRNPSKEMIALADYASEIRKIKHPFDQGKEARVGIEI